MFSEVIRLGVSILFCAILLCTVIYLQRRRERKLAEKVRQDTIKELRNGRIKKQGEVGLIIEHVYSEDIVDTFVVKFNEAYTNMAGDADILRGDVRIWFRISDVKMSKTVRKNFEKAGFHISNAK